MNLLEKIHIRLDYFLLYIPGLMVGAVLKCIWSAISRIDVNKYGVRIVECYKAQLWSDRLGRMPIRSLILLCATTDLLLLAGSFILAITYTGLATLVVFFLVIAITIAIILYVVASIGPYPGTVLNLRSDGRGVRSIHMGFWPTLCINYCARMSQIKIFTDSFLILDCAVKSGYKGEVLLVSHLLHNHVDSLVPKIAKKFPTATVKAMQPAELHPLSGLYVLCLMMKLRSRLSKKNAPPEFPQAMAGIRIIFR